MVENSTITLFTGGVILASSVTILYYFKLRDGLMFRKKSQKRTLLDENAKYSLKLIEKIEVSHNTRKFRFGLPSSEHVLGLSSGQHVYLSAKVGHWGKTEEIDGKLVVRPYTPVSSDEDRGYVELMIKVYFRNTNPKFPDGGKMSQYLESLQLGDAIDFRGPSGLIVYEGNNVFKVKADKKAEAKRKVFNKISMIAGGTGITPMLQVISAILRNPTDSTKIKLLFANQSEEDILCREELDDLAAKHSDRFQVWYTLSKSPESWRFSRGYIDENMIKNHLFPPTSDSGVLLCGPPAMINSACIPNLDKLAYDPDNRLLF